MRSRKLKNLVFTSTFAMATVVGTTAANAAPVQSEVPPAPQVSADSDDIGITGNGDENGFHLMTADAASPEAWTEVAMLVEPGFGTDRWIGQYCVTDDRSHAVVVYAPREYTNAPAGMYAGAFAAVVDLETGAVSKLDERTSLAYYNPSCGEEGAVLSALIGDDGVARTRIQEVDIESAEIEAVEVDGQLSSPVAYGDGFAAVSGGQIVAIDREGAAVPLLSTGAAAFDLNVDADGGLGFLVLDGEATAAVRYADGEATELARVVTGQIDLHRSAEGEVLVKGLADAVEVEDLPGSWGTADVPVGVELSSDGGMAVVASELNADGSVAFDETADLLVYDTAEGSAVEAIVPLDATTGADEISPALAEELSQDAAFGALDAEDPATVPWDPDRSCAMPRNDPNLMSYQPNAAQVEWATDLAVRGALTQSRPADWNNLGLPAFAPQVQFPPVALDGGGTVPAQIMFGIIAQESNGWHASNHAADGYSGNIHQGGFYGNRTADGDTLWEVNWDDVDCGYGIAQVTTGMHRDDTVYTELQQRLITVDYASNIAAGLQILQDKWNQTREAGLILDDGDPTYLQNWWFALWAYNTGFYPESEKDQHHGQWGVGWANNPANPVYMPGRDMFLFTHDIPDDWEGLPDNWDADSFGYGNSKHPNLWSYPERVIGFSFDPLRRYDFGTGEYPAAYLNASGVTGLAALPEFGAFCTPSGNNCDVGGDWNEGLCEVETGDCLKTEPGPCAYSHLHCWWHLPVDANICPSYCGTERLEYEAGDPEPARPTYTSFAPNCASPNVPSSGYIRVIDSVAETQGGPNSCSGAPVSQSGTFSFEFPAAATDPPTYPSKIDLHQIGGGYRGHFWFTHTRNESQPAMEITGTWELDTADRIDGWAKVYVHIPSRQSHTQQAPYQVHGTTLGTRDRYLNTVIRANTWVEIGAYEFDPAQPQSVTLSNQTADGLGLDGITYDAVAFAPLPAKPKHMVVAMGDSFISGEGAGNYYTETDRDYGLRTWNACRRSKDAWPREVVPPGWNYSFGDNADVNNNGIDFQFVACSGARATDFDRFPDYWEPGGGDDRQSGQFNEYPQLYSGVLSADTTLVMLSIGGNDAKFSAHVNECVDFRNPNCATAENESLMQSDVESALDEVADLLPQIRSRAPNAEILLVGYPSLFSDDPFEQCFYSDGKITVDDAESILLYDMAQQLRTGMVNIVDGLDSEISYVSAIESFAGHEICNGDDNPLYFNTGIFETTGPGDFGDFSNPSRESMHPNLLGVIDGYVPAVENGMVIAGV
ncbi:golvesin C-terminal-like domain-containing protein [Glycomyces dulcitolivorans]|uniref:golvesin C-terminal-like domain-containing protein n=1 Tax=Glycomyces dulcitolivorans TaxID=2200759 RepID=UPI000DD478A5|nr:SGNH/GDSL hydrolase family protein [Glycomyces dulcitolivorans]